jgi:hypothetical protein
MKGNIGSLQCSSNDENDQVFRLHDPGQKSRGRVGVKENFRGVGVNFLLQNCENPERSQIFFDKCHFWAKKIKILGGLG